MDSRGDILNKVNIICLALLLTACGNNGLISAEIPAIQASGVFESASPALITQTPVNTPSPTRTPIPTKTSIPTMMPYSTLTPMPPIAPVNLPYHTPGLFHEYVPGRVYNPGNGCPVDPSDVEKTLLYEDYYYLRNHINLMEAQNEARLNADRGEKRAHLA